MFDDKKTKLPNGTVITTACMDFGMGTAAIFETTVYDPEGTIAETRRYSTESAAQRGHEQAVGAWGILLS